MTNWSIFRTCLVCFAFVCDVRAAIIAEYSEGLSSPAIEEWGATKQVLFTSSPSDEDNAAFAPTHLAVPALPSTHQETLSVFERYIAGLGRLFEALQDTERNWEAGTHVSSAASEARLHETVNFKDEIQKLFALAGTIERFSAAIKQKYPDNGEDEMQGNRRAEEASSSRLHAALTATVTDLLRLFDQYFVRQSVQDENVSGEGRKEEKMDNLQVLVETLKALAEAHTNYTVAINASKTPVIANTSTSDTNTISDSSSSPLNSHSSINSQEHYATAADISTTLPAAAESSAWRPLDWYENQRGLLRVAAQLKALYGAETLGGDGSGTAHFVHPPVSSSTADIKTSSSTTSTTTTTTVTPRRSGEQPCLPPFQQIAYRMCILEEMQLKLSWSDAQEFCRERGAELAVDMTVIKARRFLNDLYGEYGTRSRWPVWAGGRRSEQMKWRWAQRDFEVPSFLWAPSEPREYTGNAMPEGVCMILDGYRRYHGASLPCHLRRRFICQLLQ